MQSLSRELRRLLIALGYFTRVPIPAWVGWSAEELNRSARYFPLIGAGVGVFSAAVLWTSTQALPPALAVVLAMAASVLLTGAFHEDGLADTADGLGGAAEPDRALAIMRDSRIGSFGAIALMLVLLGKYASLSALLNLSTVHALSVLVLAHAASRGCALFVMAVLPYVRPEAEARARAVAAGAGTVDCGIGIALGLVPLAAAVVLGVVDAGSAGLALLLAALVTIAAVRYFRHRLGGYTGDCLGATQQLTELAIYIAFCAQLA